MRDTRGAHADLVQCGKSARYASPKKTLRPLESMQRIMFFSQLYYLFTIVRAKLVPAMEAL